MPAKTANALLVQRLRQQRLIDAPVASPAEIVGWLGAVQAQDYAGAKWAVGQRAPGLVDADMERAFNEGAILRTHVLRPTWHFLAREDIGWILSLSAPRVHQANAFYYRQSGLDAAVLTRTRRAIERALDGGAFLTRTELAEALARARAPAEGPRLAYILMHAELEQVICSGPRRGKQFTYALLDARAPARRELDGDEALAELMRRYFQSHGPATVRDCSWWSGLTVKQVSRGIEILGRHLTAVRSGDRTFWQTANQPTSTPRRPPALLLPNYDEYFIAYKDRDVATQARSGTPADALAASVFAHHVVLGGRLAGAWSRELTTKHVAIRLRLSRRITRAEAAALRRAATTYGAFLGMPVTWTMEEA